MEEKTRWLCSCTLGCRGESQQHLVPADISGAGGFMPQWIVSLAKQKTIEACTGLQLYLWGYKWEKPTGWKEILKNEDWLLAQAEFLQRLLSVWVPLSIDDPDLKHSSIWGLKKYIHLWICKSLGQEFRPLEKISSPWEEKKNPKTSLILG